MPQGQAVSQRRREEAVSKHSQSRGPGLEQHPRLPQPTQAPSPPPPTAADAGRQAGSDPAAGTVELGRRRLGEAGMLSPNLSPCSLQAPQSQQSFWGAGTVPAATALASPGALTRLAVPG